MIWEGLAVFILKVYIDKLYIFNFNKELGEPGPLCPTAAVKMYGFLRVNSE